MISDMFGLVKRWKIAQETSGSKRLYDQNYAKGYSLIDDKLKSSQLPKLEYYPLLINKELKKIKDAEVLDLGCGTGRYWHLLKSGSKLIGVDASTDMLKIARKNLKNAPYLVKKLVNSDVHGLDLPGESFDLIFSIGVFAEHTRLTREILEKIKFWLKPGGIVLLTGVDSLSTANPKSKIRELIEKLMPATENLINWVVGYKYMSKLQAELIAAKAGFKKIRLTNYQDGVHKHWILSAIK